MEKLRLWVTQDERAASLNRELREQLDHEQAFQPADLDEFGHGLGDIDAS